MVAASRLTDAVLGERMKAKIQLSGKDKKVADMV